MDGSYIRDLDVIYYINPTHMIYYIRDPDVNYYVRDLVLNSHAKQRSPSNINPTHVVAITHTLKSSVTQPKAWGPTGSDRFQFQQGSTF